MRNLFILILGATTLFYTCNNDDDQGEDQRNLILNYLEDNNLSADEDDSGLFYIINEEGDTRRPGPDDLVTLSYVGTYLDGDTIGRILPYPLTDPLSRLITGFREGIPFIGRGGNITLLMPSNLAFGSNPPIGIRANAVVRYDVTLEEDQNDVDQEILADYFTDNDLTLSSHPSGMFYDITVEGDGENPTLSDRVTVEYRGTLLDGEEFDATAPNSPRTFSLDGLIEGWQIAIPLLSRGGEGVFYIPSQLCYGSYPPAGIPGNAILRFEIKLVTF